MDGMKSGPWVIGLLGGIGSGKSEVARAFARQGARVLDADRIAHRVLDQPEVRRRLVRRWGPEILKGNGRVNRATLAARAFASDRDVRTINRIVHPAVKRAMKEEIRKARMRPSSRKRPIVLDVPLLLEAGSWRLCDVLVFVDAPRDVRLRRLRRRSGWPAAELARRERFQTPLREKRRAAQFVVDNRSDKRRIDPQVRSILEALNHA